MTNLVNASNSLVIVLFLSCSLISAPSMACTEKAINSVSVLDVRIQNLKSPVLSFLSSAGDLKEANSALQEYTDSISETLACQKYRFSLGQVPDEYKAAFKGLDIALHRILADSSNALGRLAQELEEEYGVDLIYSPMLLELVGGLGTFVELPSRSMLILTNDSVFNDSYANHTNGHELIHMKFWAFRKGLRTDFLPKAPVHISYESEQPINQNSDLSIYQNYMSFEELVTFAFNISRKAESLAAMPSAIPLTAGLNFEIKKMNVVSENVLLASERGLKALKQGLPMKLNYPEQLNGDFFEISGTNSKGFVLRVFLSKEEQTQCSSSCGNILSRKLQNAIKLAEFNKRFFTANPQLIEASSFEGEQSSFISNL